MRLHEFIIADDIRREVGNKISIMGIYQGDMIFTKSQQWPIAIRIGAYIKVLLEDSDLVPDKYVLKIYGKDKVIAELGGDILMTAKLPHVILPLVIFPLPISEPGTLEFEIDIFSKDQITFTTKANMNVKVEL